MLKIENVSFKIKNSEILKNINFTCNQGEFLTIVGPNGCGKSTLLKIISRIYKPTQGSVKLFDKNIRSYDSTELARILAILPQQKSALGDITVEQLVQYGRYPHTKFGNRLTPLDHQKVDQAIKNTGINHLKGRTMATLSGGENQMAWIAMCVAQDTKIALFDEPTTYLDISYQLEVLELIKKLNKAHGLTIISVLHDINQAIKYSDRIFMMKKGEGYCIGDPSEVFSENAFAEVFEVEMDKLKNTSDSHNIYYQPLRSLKRKQ